MLNYNSFFDRILTQILGYLRIFNRSSFYQIQSNQYVNEMSYQVTILTPCRYEPLFIQSDENSNPTIYFRGKHFTCLAYYKNIPRK